MNYPLILIIFLCQEVVALVVFPILARFMGPKADGWNPAAILKGILERLLLYVAFIHGYPQMLIAFGAMKLGTRLHPEKDADISNNYFLIGNFLSILFAMAGAIVAGNMHAVSGF